MLELLFIWGFFFVLHISSETSELDWRGGRRNSAQLKFSTRCDLSNVHEPNEISPKIFFLSFSRQRHLHTPDRCPAHRWRSLNSSQFHPNSPLLILIQLLSYIQLGIDSMNGAQFTQQDDDQSRNCLIFQRYLHSAFNESSLVSIRAIQTVVEHVHEWWLSFNSRRRSLTLLWLMGSWVGLHYVYDGRTSRAARDRERQTRSCCISFEISTEWARALSAAQLCFSVSSTRDRSIND